MSNVVIAMQALVQEWEDLLPTWAVRHAVQGVLEAGAQLPTRDGRRMGNAHIVAVLASRLDLTRPYYSVLTDAGNSMILNSTEINEIFWPPAYIADVSVILAKFERSKEAEPQ